MSYYLYTYLLFLIHLLELPEQISIWKYRDRWLVECSWTGKLLKTELLNGLPVAEQSISWTNSIYLNTFVPSAKYLKSWTKVLGQICSCGDFSHAPNKQSRVNSTTLAWPHPHPTYNVGHFSRVSTCMACLGDGGGQKRILKG